MVLAGGRITRRRAGLAGVLVEAAFGVLLAAGLALEVAVVLSRRPSWPVGLALVLITAAVCGAALLRRRFPAPAAAAAIVLCGVAELIDWRTGRQGQPAPIACLALLVVVASAVRHLPGAAGAVAVATGSAAVAAGTVERYATYLAQDVPNALTATKIMVAGWAVAVSVGLWRRVGDARRRAMVDEVRRTERLALARDLHDVAAHHLTGLIIQAQVAQLATDADPPTVRATLAEIETAGAEALASVRQVVRLLRGDQPELPTLPGSLAGLLDRFDGTGVRAALDLPDGPPPADWPPEITAGIYRIVQEALTNVARHARDARTVTVTLAHAGRTIRLCVADDGQPGRSARPDGHGLVGMRERAAALGGELSAGPRTPTGWTVEATIPAPGGS
ncbi:sensor histidine kinase [Micromonospora terminaliae]|uniref:histidine kinase n=1 Tax=Micromonospora terminaliae TaxID=1914461 RepID=A0AAJ2ZGH1_9ACTN|nr:sensor histidine kinase [Micromonospora terminaliae]NES28454.1 sensor histidine kinase [Micromonospora terminaliae]QGL45816.1 sensor histidine kinase [Micromonospora terminaliae]